MYLTPKDEPGSMPTDRRARILLVDDDEAVRSVLGRALVEEGHEVVEVKIAGEPSPLRARSFST